VSLTTPLPGVRLHPNGASWQVRISPYPDVSGFPTVDEANEYAVELRKLKRAGVRVAPTRESVNNLTLLGDVAREYLERLADIGGRNGTPYSTEGLAKARHSCLPWLGEQVPTRRRKGVEIDAPPAIDERTGLRFAEMPVAALSLQPIDRYLTRRARDTRRAAIGEQQSLAKILQLAQRHGERVDPALLALEPLRRVKTKRRGLTLAELRFLAEHAQPSQQAVFLLGGTLGGRIMELLRSEDAWFDLDERSVTIPAHVAKERREKTLDLLPEEVALVKKQRLVRSAETRTGPGGTCWTFPRVEGGPWARHSGFWNRVVLPTRARAAVTWRHVHGLTVDAPTPFEWIVTDRHGRPVIDVDGTFKTGGFAPHDLRRGAADLLLSLGLPLELVAARLGHKDAGTLVATTYSTLNRDRLRRELDRIAADGGIDGRLAKLAEVGG
jgi:integrase